MRNEWVIASGCLRADAFGYLAIAGLAQASQALRPTWSMAGITRRRSSGSLISRTFPPRGLASLWLTVGRDNRHRRYGHCTSSNPVGSQVNGMRPGTHAATTRDRIAAELGAGNLPAAAAVGLVAAGRASCAWRRRTPAWASACGVGHAVSGGGRDGCNGEVDDAGGDDNGRSHEVHSSILNTATPLQTRELRQIASSGPKSLEDHLVGVRAARRRSSAVRTVQVSSGSPST